jgi:hypothetical protein
MQFPVKLKTIILLVTISIFMPSHVMSRDLEKLSKEEKLYLDRFLGKKLWYGAYFEGKKIGTAYLYFYRDPKTPQNLIFESFYDVNLIIDGKERASKTIEKLYFDISNGNLTGCETKIYDMPGEKTSKLQAKKMGGLWKITDSIGNSRQVNVLNNAYDLKAFLGEDLWVITRPKIGEKFTIRTFECEKLEYLEINVEVENIQTSLIWGVKVETYDLIYNDKVLGEYTGTYLLDGRAWKTNIGPFKLQLEPARIAKNMTIGALDFNKSNSIKYPIEYFERLKNLKVNVSGPTLTKIPNSYKQNSIKNSDNSFTVSIGENINYTEAATEIDNLKFTKNSFEYPTNNPVIQNIIRDINGASMTKDEKIWSILAYTSNSLIDDYFSDTENVLEIIQKNRGDCTEHAKLFVTLARAAGIPAREAFGLIYNGDSDNPGFSAHAWAEVIEDGHWVGVDPSWGQRTIPPVYIKTNTLSEMMGIRKIEVLEKKYNYLAPDKEISPIKQAYRNKDYKKIITDVKLLAEKGDAAYQFYFATLHDKGKLLPKDDIKSLKWYLLSARQGYSKAQYRLATNYFLGKGVPKNKMFSAFWYTKAAANGNLKAAYYLAQAYERGSGVPKDQNTAFGLYKFAARAAFPQK